jgi:hypothetical protein
LNRLNREIKSKIDTGLKSIPNKKALAKKNSMVKPHGISEYIKHIKNNNIAQNN